MHAMQCQVDNINTHFVGRLVNETLTSESEMASRRLKLRFETETTLI